MKEKCEECRGTKAANQEKADTCTADKEHGCGGCGCGGCVGGCPREADGELVWDYDDAVLVFSSDMLEESE